MNLVAPLYASAAPKSVAQPAQAQVPLTQEEINYKAEIPQKIENIQVVTKHLNKLIAGITALAIGGAITGGFFILLAGSFGIAFTIGTAGTGSLAGLGLVGMAVGFWGGITAGVTTLIVSGGASFPAWTNVSPGQILEAFVDAQKLKKMENAHLGTLTKEQINIIDQFNHKLMGPIGRGIKKGMQLKKAKDTIITQAFKQNSTLSAMLGGEKKARQFIQKYLDDNRELNNFRLTYQDYQTKKQVMKKESAKLPILTPNRIKVDLKIVGLDLKYGPVKGKIASKEKKLNKIHQQYPAVKAILADSVQAYINEADQIIKELFNEAK
jgi:hypothetical protein